MKHLIVLLAISTAFFSSCKKDKQLGSNNESAFKKNLSEMKLSNGNNLKFLYDVNGRIKEVSGALTIATYQHQPAFSVKQTYVNNGTVYELKNTVRNAQGKVANADIFTGNKHLSKLKFSYNSEGNLIKTSWERVDIPGTGEMNYYYDKGNLVKILEYGNGKLTYTHLYEYESGIVNPFKLDWHETIKIGFILDDQFGKPSKNLLKKETVMDANGTIVKQVAFNFTVNAEGYPVSLTKTSANYSIEYIFTFQ